MAESKLEDFSTLSHISPGLTDDEMTKALSKWFGEEVAFTHWEYVSGTGKGDAYLSELIRIRIHGISSNHISKHVQVLLKRIPHSLCRRLTFRSEDFFDNEIKFYLHILPALLKFQSSKNIPEPFDNYAKIFHTYSDGVNDTICLEDANIEGFISTTRQEGIDVDHCKITLKTFAKFHALSLAFKDQDSDEFECIRNCIHETYYHERLWDWYEKFWKHISFIALDAVEKEYPGSIYVEKMKSFQSLDTLKACIDACCNTLSTGVISHGDSWTNNFLYKYQNEIPIDTKMIDFQLTRCATPVLDISFFFYACTTQDLRTKHYDNLLKYYYEVLAKQITDLGSDPMKVYSWELFMDEIKRYSFFGLAFSFESTPVIILDPEDAINMDLEGDKKLNILDVWHYPPIKSKKGRLREADNVVHAVDKGYI